MPDTKVEQVVISIGDVELEGDLSVPPSPRGLVVFAHGSGSSRHSPRNRYVAEVLQRDGIATLLLDLLTPEEEAFDRRTGQLRFDIELLALRLAGATDWAAEHSESRTLAVSYFGASTGGGAALVAAAEHQNVIAVVSRGGRPDLAGRALPRVRAATLLIVGGNDKLVLDLNQKAFTELTCEKKLEVVPGATHLFEEPGALETVARLAAVWCGRFFTARAPQP